MTTNDILFACVCAAAIYCRSITAIIFCALYGIHSFYSESMAQWMRYVSLILIDSGVAFLATSLKRPSRASVITGVFSGLFLVINCAGFLAWYLYLPPTPYDAACSAVYVAMAALLIREGWNGGGWDRVRGVAGTLARAAMRKGMGVHNEDADKV